MALTHEMKKTKREHPDFCPIDNGRRGDTNGIFSTRTYEVSYRAYKKARREKDKEDAPVFKVEE